MGGDEMFGGCLDQQPGLKKWMAAQNISDYNALQQYFTKRLLGEVMPKLQPQPPIVVWELSDALQSKQSCIRVLTHQALQSSWPTPFHFEVSVGERHIHVHVHA
jgi:N-acetyl-beta-hexosaminidase